MEPKLFIGVDPGLTGCAAAISSSGKYVGFFDIPTIEKESKAKKGTKAKVKRKVDGAELYNLLVAMTDLKPDAVILTLEAQTAMPPPKSKNSKTIGAASLMSLGHTYGVIESAIQIAGIKYDTVSPRSWKNRYKIPGDKDGGKKYALSMARIMFPQAPLKLIKHHNRAEALLLAKYGFDVYQSDI